MDWLSFIVKLVEATAWPAVVVLVLIRYQNALERLIKRIRSLKYKDAETSFSDEISTIQSNQREKSNVKLSIPAELEFDISNSPPAYIITRSWNFLHNKIRMEGRAKGLFHDGRESISQILAALGVEPNTIESVASLRRLRNWAAHADDDVDLNVSVALAYRDVVVEVLGALKAASKD